MDEFLSLRFIGNGVLPSNTRCKDVARLISAAEQLIESVFEETDAHEGEISVCLDKIESASLGLKFSASQMAVAMTIWSTLATAVNSRKIEKLPAKARESFGEILSFVKSRNCTAEISDSKHSGSVLASITPDMEMPEVIRLSGRTSLIGEVVRVGGAEPKVRLKLASGKVMSCDTSEAIAKLLGGRLYEIVTCQGEATWDLGDNSLIRFRIKAVNPFIQGSVSDAFARLAGAMPNTLARWNAEGIENLFPSDAA